MAGYLSYWIPDGGSGGGRGFAVHLILPARGAVAAAERRR